jgi:glycosyltransferase-like protein LARGE
VVEASQALGLVENQSDWYIPGKLWKNHRPWPALGRGLNTGVILMDLAKLRKQGWSQTWRTVAESDLVTQLSTSLADQDVLNAVLRRQSDLLYPLPCKWNVQMSDNSLSDTLCYHSKHGDAVNVIHFNSPKKLNSVNKHINFFKNLHLTFLQYDGNLLRRELYNCQNTKEGDTQAYEDDPSSYEDPCHNFRSSGNILYRSHIYFLPYCSKNYSSIEVTLVAQLSLDRLHMVEQIVDHWKGPISFALYLTDPESQIFLEYYENSALLRSRCDVGYHVVYKEGEFYPVNFLRNLALDHATTEYVFLSDVDFLPSLDIARTLQTSITNLDLDNQKRVLVVPAFETQRYKSSQVLISQPPRLSWSRSWTWERFSPSGSTTGQLGTRGLTL